MATTIAGCPVFPANNIWNTPVDALPVTSDSDALVAIIGAAAGLRIDDTMPINLVRNAPLVPLAGLSTPESDAGAYPIPDDVVIEAAAIQGADHHVIVVDTANGMLYEVFYIEGGPGHWSAAQGSAAKWDLNSNALRPDGWTSADASGLPILPGVLRYAEVAAGEVTHALRCTAPHTRGNGSYTWPARHYASHNNDGPMMGQRFRLKASFDISGFTPRLQVILRGLKRYGLMLADNGMAWGCQHDQDSSWDATELATLHQVLGSNLEAVDVCSLMSNPDSGQAGCSSGTQLFIADRCGRATSIPFSIDFCVAGGAFSLASSPAPGPEPTGNPAPVDPPTTTNLTGIVLYPPSISGGQTFNGILSIYGYVDVAPAADIPVTFTSSNDAVSDFRASAYPHSPGTPVLAAGSTGGHWYATVDQVSEEKELVIGVTLNGETLRTTLVIQPYNKVAA